MEFFKFVVDKEGNVVGRYGSLDDPAALEDDIKSSYKKYKSFKPPFPFTNPFLATVLSKLRIHLHKKQLVRS